MKARSRLSPVLLGCFLLTAWLYAWTPASFSRRWVSRQPVGLYPELTESLLAGHLFLRQAPDPRLLALADPYDPAQNALWRVNDLSLYRGRYFLYHGIAPALILFAPIRILTGRHLEEPAAVLIFCLAGALCSLLLLVRIRQRHCPQSGRFIFGCCVAILLVSQGFYVVRTGANHVAIASAFGLLMASLLCLETASRKEPYSLSWLGLASLAYGLAVASRPNYVLGGAALVIPPLIRWKEGGIPWPQAGKMLAASALPFAAVIAGLLLYNHARFGNSLEFGVHYILGGQDQRAYPAMGLRNIPPNVGPYLLQPGTYRAEFPFLLNRTDHALGILLSAPFVWLAPLALLTLTCVPGTKGETPGRTTLWVYLLIFTANFGLLLCLPSAYGAAEPSSANDRYLLDFLPALLLLAALGAMTADQALRNRPPVRRGFAALVAGLTAVSVLSALSLDFGRWPPETYQPLARILNIPTYVWQKLRQTKYGPVSVELEFPAGHMGEREPILATGDGDSGDLVYVYYQSEGTVRFGLVGVGTPGPLGPPIRVKPGKSHRLDISAGSLYPSVGHPLMADFSEQQAAYVKRHVRLLLDGAVALDAPAYFHSASPREIYLGRAPFLQGYTSASFGGRILEHHRLALVAPDASVLPQPVFGTVLLKVRLPLGNRDASAEPLVVTGIEQAGDFIYIRYQGIVGSNLALTTGGGGGKVTDWLPVDFAVPHTIDITLGSLFPPAGHVLLSFFLGKRWRG